MSITRMGATEKYSDNWETIFGGKGRSTTKKKAAPATKSVKKKAKKKSAKKFVSGKGAKKPGRKKA
jgi:hypothetical protein